MLVRKALLTAWLTLYWVREICCVTFVSCLSMSRRSFLCTSLATYSPTAAYRHQGALKSSSAQANAYPVRIQEGNCSSTTRPSKASRQNFGVHCSNKTETCSKPGLKCCVIDSTLVFTAHVQHNTQRSPVPLAALLCSVPHVEQLSPQSSASWRGQHCHHHHQQQLLLIHSEVAVPAAEAPVGQAVGFGWTGLAAEAVSVLLVPAAAAEPASQKT